MTTGAAPYMKKKSVYLFGIGSIMGAATLMSQDGATKPADGSLMLDKKSYALTKAVAFETTIDNEDAIAVVLSSKAISAEKINEARAKDKESGDTDFARPFLKLIFLKKAGEFKYFSAGGGATMLGRHSAGKAIGEIKVHDGRVSGKASQALESEGMFPTGFDVRFDVALLKAGDSPAPTVVKKPGPAANVKPTVTGVFKGNGKEANLGFVSAHWGEPFSGKTGIVLVFTEKDHSKDKKPDFNAGF